MTGTQTMTYTLEQLAADGPEVFWNFVVPERSGLTTLP